MIPKPRPDCEGWWWVKQVAKSGDVSWKCLEVELYPWHPKIDRPDRVLKVKAGFWFCAEAVNTGKGLMDGSQWFPAAPPEWPGGGAAAITDRSSAMAKLESRGVDVSAFAARVTDIVQKGFNTAIANIKTAQKGSALFIPLKQEYFEAFESGQKTEEYRPYGPRWNERTCPIGRRVVISLGYGTQRRLTGTIMSFRKSEEVTASAEWRACYGTKGHKVAACIGIALDRCPAVSRCAEGGVA